MAKLNLMDDVLSPVVVVAVDMITQQAAPTYNEWACYGMTGIGYIGSFLGFGGDFVKNLGIASLPLTARHLKDRIQSGTSRSVSTSRMAFRPAGMSSPIRQTVVPEFQDVRVS